MGARDLLGVLMDYCLAYASRYLICARQLCQDMLRRYAEIGRIDVPIPRYRGFHVRPSTLVAKIVLHYGSDVQMQMDCDGYDASAPIDLFRANEKINAQKRRWLAEQIERLPFISDDRAAVDVRATLQRAVDRLAEEGKLLVYQQPLTLADDLEQAGGTLLERVVHEMARLQATGKIDIDADLTITFVGDQRVLADLKLLAEHGYGEDRLGNNITLPRRLGYLRR